MTYRGISGNRFHHVDRPLGRPTDKRALDATMLIAQRDFQVKNVLPVALEPEMPRLDNACVDGADRHFMDLIPFHAEKVHFANRRSTAGMSAHGIGRASVGAHKSHWF